MPQFSIKVGHVLTGLYGSDWESRLELKELQANVVHLSLLSRKFGWGMMSWLICMLGEAGYFSLKLPWTNNRGDGLLTAVHRDYFKVLNYRELLFNDFGDRVAQLLHVESVIPSGQGRNSNIQQQTLIVNTHLLFPHDHSLCIVRLRQVHMLLQYVESYQKEHNLDPMSVILCGDWNGSKRGHVYKFLRSQGFVSSYDTAHHYTDSDADAHKNSSIFYLPSPMKYVTERIREQLHLSMF